MTTEQILTFGGTAFSFFIAMYIALFKYAFAQKDKELANKFNDLHQSVLSIRTKLDVFGSEAKQRELAFKAEQKLLLERIIAGEKTLLKNEGKLDLICSKQAFLSKDVDELKTRAAFRSEYDSRIQNLESNIKSLLLESRTKSKSGNYYAYLNKGSSYPPPKK